MTTTLDTTFDDVVIDPSKPIKKVHVPVVKRTLSGKKIPLEDAGRNEYWAHVPPGYEVPAGGHRDPNHPSRKHDVERDEALPATDISHYTGPLRRRDRRWIARVHKAVSA